MAEESVKLKFEADIADFKKKVAEMPEVTKSEAAKMVKAYSAGLKKINKANEDSLKKSEQGVQKLMKAMGFGEKVEKLTNLSEGLKMIGPAGLAGAAGMAAMAVSVGSVVAVGAGVVKFAGWISDATAESEKLARPLALIAGMEVISSGSIAAAAEYRLQIATLGTVSSGFAQVLVDEMSPAMSNTAAIATGAAVEMLQLAKATQTAADAFLAADPVAAGLLEKLVGMAFGGTAPAMLGLANDIGIATGAWDHFAEVGRGATEAITDDAAAIAAWEESKKRHDAADDKLLEKTKQVNEEIGRKQVAALKASEAEWDRHVDAINKMIDTGYADRVREETQAVYDAMDAEIARTKAINDMIDAGMAAASEERFQAEQKAQDDINQLAVDGAALRTQLNSQLLNEAMALGSQLADQAQQHHEDEIAHLDAQIAKRQDRLKAAIANGNTERADEIRRNIATDKAKRDLEIKQAKRAHAASKAIAIMGIAVSTAQATMALLASPAIAIAAYGAPAIAAGIAVGTGALQAAAVAAAPAPKFHTGRAAPDEKTATVLDSESVLTGRATQALGGAKGVNALNAGAKPGGSVTVMLAIGKRQAEQIVQDGAGALSMTKADPLGAGRYGGR